MAGAFSSAFSSAFDSGGGVTPAPDDVAAWAAMLHGVPRARRHPVAVGRWGIAEEYLDDPENVTLDKWYRRFDTPPAHQVRSARQPRACAYPFERAGYDPANIPEPITPDKWHTRWADVVRRPRRALQTTGPVPETALALTETVFAPGWNVPFAVPVRLAPRALPTFGSMELEESLFVVDTVPIIRAWHTPFSEPTRRPLRPVTTGVIPETALALSETILVTDWHTPFGQVPLGFYLGRPQLDGYTALVIDPAFAAEAVHWDALGPRWGLPSRHKARTNAYPFEVAGYDPANLVEAVHPDALYGMFVHSRIREKLNAAYWRWAAGELLTEDNFDDQVTVPLLILKQLRGGIFGRAF
jgi:hypothetical protein